MDLSFLDKTSDVTPMLVKLYDKQKLCNLARNNSPDARTELAEAVSDLLSMELSPREAELVADVLIELMRQAERDLRKTLAARLAAMENVPLRLVLQIANDDIDIASPVLRHSPVLDDLDLVYIIKSKGAEYWQSIARRKVMGPNVINALAETRDKKTVINLASNTDITLPEPAVESISHMARHSDDVAMPLLRRKDIDKDVAKALFAHVGEDIKAYIRDHYADIADEAEVAVDEVVVEFTKELEPDLSEKTSFKTDHPGVSDFLPTPGMKEAARNFKERGLLNVGMIVDTLRRGQIRAFIAQLSEYCEIEDAVVLQVLQQRSGRALAIVCKAIGVIKPDFISIYLLSNRVRSAGDMVDMNNVGQAVGYFTRISEDAAAQTMRSSLDKALLEE